MDKFEETTAKMASMKPDDLQNFMSHKRRLCMCGHCRSYNECARKAVESVYCLKGRSPNCIKEEKGCVCMTCPVFFELSLKKLYFCTRGAEKEQREQKK